MRGVAEAAAATPGGVPGGLQGVVGYSDRWLVLAVLGLVVVAAYYAVVLWSTRPDRPGGRPAHGVRARPGTGGGRQPWLARLDRIEREVGSGLLSSREGHQQISETVRGFVAETTGLPAPTMTLTDLRREGPERLASMVALVYPPEFAPGDRLPRERFGEALEQARELVAQW